MDTDSKRLNQNIARIRRDIRLQSREMSDMIDADLDCSNAARLLMRMNGDPLLFLEKCEQLAMKEVA